MKVLLANIPWEKDGKCGVRAGSRWPHIKDEGEGNYLPFPFFLAYANSLLQKHGICATLIDAIAEQIPPDKFIEKISRMNFDLLVIETSTPSFFDDLNMLKKLASLGIRIVLCGPHIEIHQLGFLKECNFIDFVLYGEYEFTLLDLVKNLQENKKLSNIKGLIWRNNDEVIKNPKRPPFDINLLPWPHREGLPMQRYWDLPGDIPYPSVQMLASRGCPFSCNFCLWPQIIYQGNHYRTREIKDVVDEMEYLVRNNKFKSVYFDDDTFNIGKERMLKFCKTIKERNLQNIPWAIMARPDLMDEEILTKMRSAGLSAIKYGVESGVQKLQEASGKYLDLDKTVKIIRITKEFGIRVHLTFMFGLPEETKETIRQTIDYALGLDPDSVQFSIATPFPGTKYFEELNRKGFLISKRWLDYDGNNRSVLRTDKLTAEQLESARKQAYFSWNEHRRRRDRYRYPLLMYKLILSIKTFGSVYTLKKVSRYLKRSTGYEKFLRLFKKTKDRLKKIFSRDFYEYILRLTGILDGSAAFIGPHIVQIDLTNDCNNNCIACWCNSPLLDDTRINAITRKQSLSLEVLKELIYDLHKIHTKEIYLAGGGEPFMHPHILDIVRYIKLKRMICHINTNFTLVNESIIRELVDIGLDYITASVWAGTPEAYRATHSNKNEGNFFKIKEMLQLLSSLKKESKKNKPIVKIYNVISNINYLDIEKMIDFAVEVEAEMIDFSVIDVIPGKTDILLLSRQQIDTVLNEFNRLRDKIELLQNIHGLNFPELDLFLKRLSSEGALKGEYDRYSLNGLPCYVGWIFSRVLANGDVNPCLKSHKLPVGNIYNSNFHTIWNDQKMCGFREKAKVDKKDDWLFTMIGNDPGADIGCYRICDDLRRNLDMHQKLNKLALLEKKFLIIMTTSFIKFIFAVKYYLISFINLKKIILYIKKYGIKFVTRKAWQHLDKKNAIVFLNTVSTQRIPRDIKGNVDIILVMSPPWSLDMPPLSLAYLDSYLKSKNIISTCLDLNIKIYNTISSIGIQNLWSSKSMRCWEEPYFSKSLLKILEPNIHAAVKQLISLDTKIIGFSVNQSNSRFTIELAKRIKKLDKDKIIIFGGPGCFWRPNSEPIPEGMYDNKGQCLVYPGLVDIFVVGEGEETLYEIIKTIKEKKELLNLAGTLIFKDGKYLDGGRRKLIDNLDTIPFPKFEDFNPYDYSELKFPIIFSRGCIGRCNFCNDWSRYNSYRHRSAENIFMEIKYQIENWGIRNFFSCDLLMNGDLKELNDLCDLIMKSKYRIRWWGQAIIRSDMDYSLLVKMKKVGCLSISYGCETFSDKLLKRMNKRHRSEDAEKVLKMTKRAGIQTAINLIVGFPGEDEKEFQENIKFIKRNHKHIDMVTNISPLFLTTGSDVLINSQNYGIVNSDKECETKWYSWYALDGNSYDVRKNRIERLVHLFNNYKKLIVSVNLYED